MKGRRYHSASGAKAPYAQARPDEASRRSTAKQGGGLSCFAPCPHQGAGEGVGGLGSCRLNHTIGQNWDGLTKLIRQIRKDPKLSEYTGIGYEFIQYLRDMEKATFVIHGFDNRLNKGIKRKGKYIHRWTSYYRNRQLVKLYKLDTWWKENKTPVTLLTLTTYQDGELSRTIKGMPVTIDESFILLKSGWDKLSKILRKYVPDILYIWVIEPHRTGYPHIHVILFGEVSRELQEKMKRLWAEKYQVGSKTHGLNFMSRSSSEDIASLRNYLMKYISKGFLSDGKWTKEEFVYNVLIWKFGYRTFQPSKKLKRLIKWEDRSDKSIFWHMGEAEYLVGPHLWPETHIIWEKLIIPEWLPFKKIIR